MTESVHAEDVALQVDRQLMGCAAEKVEVVGAVVEADDEKVRVDALDNADDRGDLAALGEFGVNGDAGLLGEQLCLLLKVLVEGTPLRDENVGDIGRGGGDVADESGEGFDDTGDVELG